ncbi:YybH family protein [Pontibacter mangrovi]|uniref:SgcJ/EcaC family oxidoreductase n=1 Tax=Pontibacter mangrovi TaxID=2589816 RepID=A0A501W859_9BACT|nr:SgcJ/EcaC family oxidoreductase [Pontibacter mangrovi]TPE44224.1 SgcJ/EcaC family oxidoreductase [Pontibacter mangrovi]
METTTVNIGAEIKRANEKFIQAFTEGNAAGIANLYTDEGMLLPTGMEAVKGKPGIQEFWQGAMKMGVKGVKLETVEVLPCENTAIEMGNYTLTGEGGTRMDKGKYIVVWQKQNGQWKLHKDIWNTSLSAT